MVRPRLPGPTHNSYQAQEQNLPTKACKPPAAPRWALGLSERPGTLRPGVVPFVLRHALTLLLPHTLNTDASIVCRTNRPCSHAISSTVIFSLVLRAILLTYHLNNCWKEITFREGTGVNHSCPWLPSLAPFQAFIKISEGSITKKVENYWEAPPQTLFFPLRNKNKICF